MLCPGHKFFVGVDAKRQISGLVRWVFDWRCGLACRSFVSGQAAPYAPSWNPSKIAVRWFATPGLTKLILLVEGGHQSNVTFLLAPDRSVTSPWFLLAFISDHWPVSVSCAHSKRWKPRPSARNCTPRVPRRWMPTDDFAACVNNLASPPAGLAKLIAG